MLQEKSDILKGPCLYTGDFCIFCDKEITEEDLKDGVTVEAHRGQFGHLCFSSMHHKCHIMYRVSLDIGLSNVFNEEELEYIRHFVNLRAPGSQL